MDRLKVYFLNPSIFRNAPPAPLATGDNLSC